MLACLLGPAAIGRTSSSANPLVVTTRVNRGLPTVNGPVLSMTIVSTFSSRSSAFYPHRARTRPVFRTARSRIATVDQRGPAEERQTTQSIRTSKEQETVEKIRQLSNGRLLELAHVLQPLDLSRQAGALQGSSHLSAMK